MATIAELRADIVNRLLVGSTTPEPGTSVIEGWLRDAYAWAIAQLPPVNETALSITAGTNTATLPCDDIYYAAIGHKILLPSEWAKQGNAIRVNPSLVGDENRTVQVWYFKAPDTSSSATSVSTTCVFGPNWLDMLVKTRVMMDVELRLANVAGSSDANGHAQLARFFQEDSERQLVRLAGRRDTWVAIMEKALGARAGLGDATNRTGAHSEFIDLSQVRNDLTGVG